MREMKERPQYGIVTCGKPAPGPLELGPCINDPDHDGDCRFRSPFGPGTIQVHDGPPPPEVTPEIEAIIKDIMEYRRKARTGWRVTMIASAVAIINSVYTLLRAFGVI